MPSTRREFMGLGVALVCGAVGAREKKAEPIGCLDYGRSFICHKSQLKSPNNVRFWVESRTLLFDDKGRQTDVYYQCGSCKSEHTFAEKDLFNKNNFDFLPIFGEGRVLIFRRREAVTPNYRRAYKVEDVWGVPILKLQSAAPITVLDTWEKIEAATDAALPLVTQTEIIHEKSGLRAIIECPTKTMNVDPTRQLYQVDTGPIAYPDLSKRFDPPIDCLSLAFIAFNAPHFADFVIEQPTAILDKDKEVGKVYHYSNPISVKAKNVVLAVGKLP